MQLCLRVRRADARIPTRCGTADGCDGTVRGRRYPKGVLYGSEPYTDSSYKPSNRKRVYQTRMRELHAQLWCLPSGTVPHSGFHFSAFL